jgi:hypothetical protein
VRPRQARYQAALRPDMKCAIDSKALSKCSATPIQAVSMVLSLDHPCRFHWLWLLIDFSFSDEHPTRDSATRACVVAERLAV